MSDTADWRATKKAATRSRIRGAALELFELKGFDDTTVEEIARTAGVTHTTFFRYFPSKDDVVLTDDYDALMASLIRARPSTESVAERVSGALLEGMTQVYSEFRDGLLAQMKLVESVPSLRAKMGQVVGATQDNVLQAVGDQSLEARVVVSAIVAASTVTIFEWAADYGRQELPAMLEVAFDALRKF